MGMDLILFEKMLYLESPFGERAKDLLPRESVSTVQKIRVGSSFFASIIYFDKNEQPVAPSLLLEGEVENALSFILIYAKYYCFRFGPLL